MDPIACVVELCAAAQQRAARVSQRRRCTTYRTELRRGFAELSPALEEEERRVVARFVRGALS